MHAAITLSTPIATTPRVLQIQGMFDVPAQVKTSLTLGVTLPLEQQPWSVGLITGPSGAGKSSIARTLWPEQLAAAHAWRPDAALVDDFPAAMGIREITDLLCAVGLSSPPAWLRPHRTLSNGEQFRAEVARALAESSGTVVVDEFTSVVDRQVAKVASHAVQRAVRRTSRQFIAVTCHYDVEEWLQPDWVYDAATREFTWRQVQPHPRINLEIYRCDRSLWPLFARHHYLSADIHPAAQCVAAYTEDGRPVAFAAYLHFPHPRVRNIRTSHRAVVLPDWQGLGIGGQMADWLGAHLTSQGYRFRETTAHPARIGHYARSPRWRACKSRKILQASPSTTAHLKSKQLDPRRILTRTFEYVPPAP